VVVSEAFMDEECERLLESITRDFSESDRDFLKDEINSTLRELSISRSRLSFIPSSVYLLAKCPANTDAPLSLADIDERVHEWIDLARHESGDPVSDKVLFRSWKSTLTYLKREGIFQECRVTPQIIIYGYWDALMTRWKEFHRFTDLYSISYDLDEIMDLVDRILEGEDMRLNLVGKNPYVTAAAVCYIIGFLKEYNFTQMFLAMFFNITEPAIRHRWVLLVGETYAYREDRLRGLKERIGWKNNE